MHVNTFVFLQIPISLFVVLILCLLPHRHVSRGAGRNLQICISKSTGPQWRHFSNDPPSLWASLATHAEQRSTCGKDGLPGLALMAHPSACMCMCVQVQGLQQCCASGPMKREPLMRDEWSALLCVRENRLNHSSTAGCNSPATETAVIAAATVCAVLTLTYMHARTRTRTRTRTHTHTHTHTHDFLVCLRKVNYQSHAKMQLLTESKIVFQSTCRVPGLRSCLGDKVSFLTDLSG